MAKADDVAASQTAPTPQPGVEMMSVKLDLKTNRKDRKLLKKLESEGWEVVYRRDKRLMEWGSKSELTLSRRR